jgi:peptide/nickel transport system permease protein
VHPVTKTVLVRLGYGLLTLFLVSVVIFSAIEFLPGDFTQAILGQLATPETIAAFRKELGLDQSAVSRYINWISGVLRGDFGSSFSGRGQLTSGTSGVGRSREVADLIAPRLWNTLFLAGLTAIVAVPLSLFLGITSALYRNSIYDRAVSVTSLTTISFPEFFVAYVLILIFGSLWPVLPTLANVDASTPMAERLLRSALPAMTLTLVIIAHMMRMTRAAIINLLASPYIQMAILSGAS